MPFALPDVNAILAGWGHTAMAAMMSILAPLLAMFGISAPVTPAAPAASSCSVVLTQHIRANGVSQADIDAGGTINYLPAAKLVGTPWLASHNTNDGGRFLNLRPGQCVTLTGMVNGTFRVTHTLPRQPFYQDFNILRSYRADAFLQTCEWSTPDVRLVVLNRM